MFANRQCGAVIAQLMCSPPNHEARIGLKTIAEDVVARVVEKQIMDQNSSIFANLFDFSPKFHLASFQEEQELSRYVSLNKLISQSGIVSQHPERHELVISDRKIKIEYGCVSLLESHFNNLYRVHNY